MAHNPLLKALLLKTGQGGRNGSRVCSGAGLLFVSWALSPVSGRICGVFPSPFGASGVQTMYFCHREQFRNPCQSPGKGGEDAYGWASSHILSPSL